MKGYLRDITNYHERTDRRIKEKANWKSIRGWRSYATDLRIEKAIESRD
jgi:hypothetical protein